ncbi:MAG: hypothetical protein NT168_04430 [Planctomycetota bacterium]|nr:hypothetical protein [Planctomycetota bacterium]
MCRYVGVGRWIAFLAFLVMGAGCSLVASAGIVLTANPASVSQTNYAADTYIMADDTSDSLDNAQNGTRWLHGDGLAASQAGFGSSVSARWDRPQGPGCGGSWLRVFGQRDVGC